MIQRRRAAPNGSSSGTPAHAPQESAQNAAYRPLRHQTSPSNSTSTPPRFGAAPAFTPRPNHVHSNSSFSGYGNGFSPMMGSPAIGGGIGGMGGPTTGLGQYIEESDTGPVLQRLGRQVRAGVRDMAELGRSWSLIWG